MHPMTQVINFLEKHLQLQVILHPKTANESQTKNLLRFIPQSQQKKHTKYITAS
jgi:hypothetical protein